VARRIVSSTKSARTLEGMETRKSRIIGNHSTRTGEDHIEPVAHNGHIGPSLAFVTSFGYSDGEFRILRNARWL
jgi:hypothetical protein